MDFVRAVAVGWVDDAFPGWVEVHLRTASGTVAVITDKAPALAAEDVLTPDAGYPVDLELPCDVLGWSDGAPGESVATVRLSHGLEDDAGRATFTVHEDLVVSRPTRAVT